MHILSIHVAPSLYFVSFNLAGAQGESFEMREAPLNRNTVAELQALKPLHQRATLNP